MSLTMRSAIFINQDEDEINNKHQNRSAKMERFFANSVRNAAGKKPGFFRQKTKAEFL